MEGMGNRIKLARLKLKLSQANFARVGGVATNAQGHYESGFRRPRADYLFKLGAAGVDIGFLVTGSRPAPAIKPPPQQSIGVNANGSDRDLTAIRVEALIMDYLRHSLGSIAQAMVAIHQLKDHRDQRKRPANTPTAFGR
jgi:transcriptional regulator with XRE-family HTH domain